MTKLPEKKSRPTELTDAEIFRASIGNVKPVRKQNRVVAKDTPRNTFTSRITPPPEIPDTLSDFASEVVPDEFLRNGLSRTALRKLKRGIWPVQDVLDLHGLKTDEARKLLQAFLHEAMQQSLRCVLLIHGKGLNSKGGDAVLRKLSRHWLTQHQAVLGFCDASLNEGGSGAALVLLKIIR